MTINLTHPTRTEPDPTTLRRINYMTALSLAETILSETTVIPTSFDVSVPEFAPAETTIRFYFHRNPAAVREFADERWMSAVTTVREDGSEYTEATGGLCRGVQVEAWALLPADAVAAASGVEQVSA